MKKTLLSALGLAVALAFAVPALGTTEANAAATTTTTAPAATTEAAKPAVTAAKPASNGPHKKHHRKH
ncbi:MAG: hypothetical protein E5W74_27020, partial [Mesorhizobium sp.]|uniref:hypothetical protein n=1 Tax=Mesorhizobium sp. TaxID=1871066 RepID=UPI00122351EB